MTLEDLQKIIGQQTSNLQLKMPARETNPNYEYDNMGQPIIPEFRENIPNQALKIGADALTKTRDFYNTGNGFIGELLIGSGGDALENMAYGYKPKTENLIDLGLLGVTPFLSGVKGLASTAKKTDQIRNFIPKGYGSKTQTDKAFKRKVDEDFLQMQNNYKNRPDTFNGRKIDTDIAREQFSEYNKGSWLDQVLGISGNRSRGKEVHKGANRYSQTQFDELLNSPIPKGIDDKVTFLSGGAGAGKTSSLSKLPKNEQPNLFSKVYYDTNLSSSKKAIKKIDKAIKSNTGKTPVDIFYVNRSPIDSFKDVLGRNIRQQKQYGSGRAVDIDTVKNTHLGSQKAIKELQKHYKNNDLVNIKIINNNTAVPKVTSLDKIPKPLKPEVIENKFIDMLTKAKNNLSESSYMEMLNGRADPLAIKPTIGRTAGDIIYGY